MDLNMRPIGYIRSPYRDVAEIPKGTAAKHEAQGVIEILPEFAEGLEDIDGFSHLYVLFWFHEVRESALSVTPPTDVVPHGIFSTRAPNRPNPIGLTVVRLLRREGRCLHAHGIDMLDGTPVLDIKPYLSSVPAEQLRRGWMEAAEARARQS